MYDDSLAPAGHHFAYRACPSAPYEVDGDWESHTESSADAMVEQVQQHAPGFCDSILARTVLTPTLRTEQLR